MYNILISVGAGAVVGIVLAQVMGSLPAIIPAVLVTGIAIYLLSRRTSAAVEQELAAVAPLLQQRKIKEAKQQIRSIQQKYGKWQLMLDGQLQAQLGLIDYLQMKFDEALPQLQKGRFQNWMAQTCIGAIHYRKGDKEKAFEELAAAASTAPKEAIVYLIWATLLTRDGKRTDALSALDQGLQSMPESQALKTLRNTIANKKKIKVKTFPESWYQFFPEDMAQQMMMRGRRGQQQQQVPQPRMGVRNAPRR